MDTVHAPDQPPRFLRLAGHPVRWRLLIQLAHSDRRVGELCTLLGLPQNLVSYHLARLRAAEVVSRRRSSADGRDSYYRLELDRCGALLSAAGSALHPGLALIPRTPHSSDRPSQTVRVLFLCTGNSARSQMAEALAAHAGAGWLEARSAGSHPKALHPNALRAMRARGIDIADQHSKHLEEFVAQRFDYVITLCDRVRELCPEFRGRGRAPRGHAARIHWSIPDPAREGETDAESYPAFERAARELESRIAFLLGRIASGRRTAADA